MTSGNQKSEQRDQMDGFFSKFSFGETESFSNDVAFVQNTAVKIAIKRLPIFLLIIPQTFEGGVGILKSLGM